MLGGGHVRRRSIDSLIGGSPCIRRRNTALQYLGRVLRFDEHDEDLGAHAEPDRLSKVSPDKIILAKPSIASTSSYQFGGERMIMARRGLLERQSLEDSALMAHGEDLLASCNLFSSLPRLYLPLTWFFFPLQCNQPGCSRDLGQPIVHVQVL